MTKIHRHKQLFLALRAIVVLLCSGILGFSSASVIPDDGGEWIESAKNISLSLREASPLTPGQIPKPRCMLHDAGVEQMEMSAQAATMEAEHQGMSCASPDCDTSSECPSLCALACSASAVYPLCSIANEQLIDGNFPLPRWANTRVIDGLVLPPLFRPPIA